MFGIGKPGAKSLIQKLRGRGLTLDQIAALLPPDDQGRPVSRVTLSKVLGGEYSGAQLVERLRDLADGKAPGAERSTSPSRPARRPVRTARTPQGRPRPRQDTVLEVTPSRLEQITPSDVGKVASFAGHPFGWVGSNGQIVHEKPEAPPASTAPESPTLRPAPSPRRQKLRTYQQLRRSGLDETTAKRELLRQHETEQQQTKAREYERQIAASAPQFEVMARRHLAGAGCYAESDVMPLARHMTERSLLLEQPPRQGDAPQKLLAAPSPAVPADPGQQAQPIWPASYYNERNAGEKGYHPVRRTRRVALGGEQHVTPEKARAAIAAGIAQLVERGKL